MRGTCKLYGISSIKRGTWQWQIYSFNAVGGKKKNGFDSVLNSAGAAGASFVLEVNWYPQVKLLLSGVCACLKKKKGKE